MGESYRGEVVSWERVEEKMWRELCKGRRAEERANGRCRRDVCSVWVGREEALWGWEGRRESSAGEMCECRCVRVGDGVCAEGTSAERRMGRHVQKGEV